MTPRTMKLKNTAVMVTGRKQVLDDGNKSEAWFYENKGSVDVYVRHRGVTISCRIRRALLADWIKRTER